MAGLSLNGCPMKVSLNCCPMKGGGCISTIASWPARLFPMERAYGHLLKISMIS